MLTIFSVPKPFQREFNIIQKNAIQSWILLQPKCEIILFGDERGIAKIANEFGTRHVPSVVQNEFGTPLVNGIFEKAQKIAKNNILVYVNADIILMDDFVRAVEKVKKEKNFLMIGQRWDFDLKEKINFENLNCKGELRGKVLREGKLHPETGIDYFVFKKGMFEEIPPFVLGRTVWDEWLLWKAWKKEAKIIDATGMAMVVHQNHSYLTSQGERFNPWKTKEAKTNLKLAGGYGHCFTIKDATHILTSQGLKPAPKMNIMRRLELLPYLGFFIRQRKKLNNLIKRKK